MWHVRTSVLPLAVERKPQEAIPRHPHARGHRRRGTDPRRRSAVRSDAAGASRAASGTSGARTLLLPTAPEFCPPRHQSAQDAMTATKRLLRRRTDRPSLTGALHGSMSELGMSSTRENNAVAMAMAGECLLLARVAVKNAIKRDGNENATTCAISDIARMVQA